MNAVLTVNSCKDEDERFNSLFRELSDQVASYGEQANVKITSYRDPSLPYFSAVSGDRKRSILNELSTYVKICETTLNNGHKLSDSKQLIWYAIRELGLLPCSNLFDFITETDVIEVHSRELMQMFRNFVFYNYCSYSLEELCSLPWPQLYIREKGDMVKVMEIVNTVFSGQLNHCIPINDVVHVVTESNSPFKYRMDYKLTYGAPLRCKRTQKVEAFIVGEQARLLNKPKTVDEEEFLLRQYDQNRNTVRNLSL